MKRVSWLMYPFTRKKCDLRLILAMGLSLVCGSWIGEPDTIPAALI